MKDSNEIYSRKKISYWSLIHPLRTLKVYLHNKKHKCTSRLLSDYGVVQRREIGAGAFATVRLIHQVEDGGKVRVYAIKAFRIKKQRESENLFMKKLISEFCISSALNHPNIVHTLDLVLDHKNRYCTVMEYCPGGDLYSFIKEGLVSPETADGYFKQLLNGLSFIHEMGVAHRDIKPENLLLQEHHGTSILKITDFGEADVFREAWKTEDRLSYGLCGSTPYIAPEVFVLSKQGYSASKADVWSAAIVYFCMRLNGVLFYSAQKIDANYRLFEREFNTSSYPAFQSFDQDVRAILYGMLNPNPAKRYTIDEVLTLPWITMIQLPQ
ncbi:kinase-like domain-containing protein [Pilobolus umbonatus]|nr:kinase-like domain-containing protein [Pilobolus umbonatus]